MNDEVSASGRFPMIPPETQEAMRADRMAGMTLEQIAEKYHCSVNSVRKYTSDVVRARQPQAKVEVDTETDINSEVEKTVLSQHAGRILNYSKKRDSEIIAAGDAVQKHLSQKGINIDIDQIPPTQLIKLLKSPLGDDMNVNMKGIFENWLEQQLNSVKTGAPAVEGKQKVSFEDIKEMMMLNFLGKMANQGDSPQQDNSQVDKLIAENEKLRQDFRVEMERNRQEMKDLVLEKRLQTMDETNAKTVSSLSGQLNDLILKIETLKYDLPVNGSPAQKTALEELTDAVSQINNVKSSLAALGVIPAAPGAPGTPDIYKKPDGSLDFVRYAGDKIESSIKMLTETRSKPAPDRKIVQETPEPEHFSAEEAERYYQHLQQKNSMTPAETEWVNQYLPIRAQYYPSARKTAPYAPVFSSLVNEPTEPAELVEPVEHVEPDKSIYPEELIKPAEPVEPVEPKKSVMDRLKEEDNSTAQALADLGF